jgi:hypothetical protein
MNNTFSNALYLTDDYSPVIFYLSNSPNIIIKNNIFYDPALHVIWVNDNVSKQGLDVGYNLAYRSDGRKPYGSPYSHDLWQVNPMFVNPGAGDFHLQPNSPAINSGTLLDVVDDFDGIPRPLSYQFDIGAYEYPFKLDINPPINSVNSPIYITITFATFGKPITINTKIPAQLSYQSSSINCPANVTFSNSNQTVTLTQISLSASKCDLKISTIVNTDKKLSVIVSATIENDSVVPLNISQNIILNGIPNYLPLASKT